MIVAKKNSQGYIALVTVILISAVVLAIASTVSLLAIGGAQSSLAIAKGEGSMQFVQGCMEDGLLKTWNSSSYNGGNITRPEGTCIVSAVQNGGNWTITATGTTTDYNRTTLVTLNRGSTLLVNSWQESLFVPTPTPTNTPTPTQVPTNTPIPTHTPTPTPSPTNIPTPTITPTPTPTPTPGLICSDSMNKSCSWLPSQSCSNNNQMCQCADAAWANHDKVYQCQSGTWKYLNDTTQPAQYVCTATCGSF